MVLWATSREGGDFLVAGVERSSSVGGPEQVRVIVVNRDINENEGTCRNDAGKRMKKAYTPKTVPLVTFAKAKSGQGGKGGRAIALPRSRLTGLKDRVEKKSMIQGGMEPKKTLGPWQGGGRTRPRAQNRGGWPSCELWFAIFIAQKKNSIKKTKKWAASNKSPPINSQEDQKKGRIKFWLKNQKWKLYGSGSWKCGAGKAKAIGKATKPRKAKSGRA